MTIMCIPKKKRSLRGDIHDEIYGYFDKNSLCDYVLNEEFLQWMTNQNGKLRDQLGKSFIDIVVTVEEFAVARDWRKKLTTHAVGGFFELLRNRGCLDGVPKDNFLPTVIAHLYFYMGILSLDRAFMEKRL